MDRASKILLTVFSAVALAIAGLAIYSGIYGFLVLSFAVMMGAAALLAGDFGEHMQLDQPMTDEERRRGALGATRSSGMPLSDTLNPMGVSNPNSPLYPGRR